MLSKCGMQPVNGWKKTATGSNLKVACLCYSLKILEHLDTQDYKERKIFISK